MLTDPQLNSTPPYAHELNSMFLDIINNGALSPLVTSPTRENNILDLVLTTDPENSQEYLIMNQ